jgi:hypothetical protein
MDILNFLKEFWAVLIGIVTLITALVKLFAKVSVMEKDILSLKDNVGKIKDNYLHRFDDLKDRMNLQHDELINEITKLTIMIEKQSTFCQVVQEMKKK